MAETPTSEGPLQFGRRTPGRDHADRPAAFGVAARADGRIALVKVEKPEGTWFDLPGGALDPGEDDQAAVVREFAEETGLVVRPGRLIARADQYFVKVGGEPVNNRSGIYQVEIAGEDPKRKIEPDHTLEWREPLEALRLLRHDSHAWAVAAWLRTRP